MGDFFQTFVAFPEKLDITCRIGGGGGERGGGGEAPLAPLRPCSAVPAHCVSVQNVIRIFGVELGLCTTRGNEIMISKGHISCCWLFVHYIHTYIRMYSASVFATIACEIVKI